MDARDTALVDLGRQLLGAGYTFSTVTPETHRRKLANDEKRGRTEGKSLRDVFGWSKPFAPKVLHSHHLGLLRAAEAVEEVEGGLLRARVRASTLGNDLYFHSAYPTTAGDSVFFGPDSVRYAALLQSTARKRPPSASELHVVDVGCGAGPGGIVALRCKLGAYASLVDVNPEALRLATINARIAGLHEATMMLESDVLSNITDPIHVVVANPPYLKDPSARTYRDGGGELGEALALRIVRESLKRVEPEGLIIVYTGVAIVDGEDAFLKQVDVLCREAYAKYTYEELDPDVFGEELEQPAYAAVDRIAAVGLTILAP